MYLLVGILFLQRNRNPLMIEVCVCLHKCQSVFFGKRLNVLGEKNQTLYKDGTNVNSSHVMCFASKIGNEIIIFEYGVKRPSLLPTPPQDGHLPKTVLIA